MTLRSTPHQSLASSIIASMTSSPQYTIRTYPNQKPWITGYIPTELKGRAVVFKELIRNPTCPPTNHATGKASIQD
jgi:hypothetical protein